MTFSTATLQPAFGQKKRRLNHPLGELLCSGVSQRRAARLLGINPKTVARKLEHFLAPQARAEQKRFLRSRYPRPTLTHVQFDDLETTEHTKCKPLSVALAVDANTRAILSFHVSRMPAKGPLAKIARRKYGHRRDERPHGWSALFIDLVSIADPRACFVSDENPHYSRFLRRHFPYAKHDPKPGRRGCVAGQGELKKVGFDPLFSLNHTCAMFRANVNRLIRRTWCTTKKRERLADHLALYVAYHNRVLLSESTR